MFMQNVMIQMNTDAVVSDVVNVHGPYVDHYKDEQYHCDDCESDKWSLNCEVTP